MPKINIAPTIRKKTADSCHSAGPWQGQSVRSAMTDSRTVPASAAGNEGKKIKTNKSKGFTPLPIDSDCSDVFLKSFCGSERAAARGSSINSVLLS
jgi:hypothetical protein